MGQAQGGDAQGAVTGDGLHVPDAFLQGAEVPDVRGLPRSGPRRNAKDLARRVQPRAYLAAALKVRIHLLHQRPQPEVA